MSILDDAIREHLELKRAHGADESELKKLEDEAFGPPERPGEPDPFAEMPTEFMAAPEALETAEEAAPAAEEPSRRRIDIADLQEPPEPPAPAELEVEAEEEAEPQAESEPHAEAAAESEPQAEPRPSRAAEERQSIAEQPTELFDVESEVGGAGDALASEAPIPSDEEIIEAELSEPKLTPVEPTEIQASRIEPAAGEPEEEEYEEDEDFWSEQRLSDELDQALESPLTEEHELPVAPELEDEDDFEEEEEEEDGEPKPESRHEDVLEDTPDFLEDAPEDDELWFEQRPPKDFDFDD